MTDAIVKMARDMEVIDGFLGNKGRFVGDMVHISIERLAQCVREHKAKQAEWMPIETATRPRKSDKDPVDILLWDGIRQAVGHWTDTTETIEEFVKETKSGKRIYEWVEHVSGYWYVEGDFLLPTHWMPLPPAPKGSNND